MLVYVDAVERVLEADLRQLAMGEDLTAAEASERDTAAVEVASFEGAHPAPPGVAPPSSRWSTIN
jgi:hypothetical protein